MRGARAARFATLAAALASAAALAYFVFFLVGPTYTRCSLSSIGPAATPGPTTCESIGWLAMHFGGNEPGAPDLRPLLFLGAWTIAPMVALAGTRLRSRGAGTLLVGAALLIDLSSIISMGGGFMYALLCGPLLIVALVAMEVAFAQGWMG